MCSSFLSFFFFNDTATTEIYTLSLHDALPIYLAQQKYDLALVAFQRAAEADPKLPEVHLAISAILLEQKKYDQALAEIDAELKLVPQSKAAAELKAKIEDAKPVQRLDWRAVPKEKR